MPVRPRECVARVTATRVLTPDVLEADLAMVEPATLAFDAGQWVSVPFGPKTVRAYSIASSPRAPALITLCADVAPGGIGSAWFRGLRPGQDVRFKGPLGGFVLDPGDARRLVLVAEEIGIVPIRSIAGELAAAGFERPTTLVYSARDPAAPTVDELVTDVAALVAYVAGGAATIDAVRAVLTGKGLERKAVKWEKFW
ncbi:MAG: FAD-dependent oxidoreductase [Candidatus Rokuibacteriota bacterium]|nr:MAG: FAD-dependent oxidoreductase [Candidatus Rokubacteria bacterium]